MHFVLYSWLYQTSLYVGMAISIAVGGMFLMLKRQNAGGEEIRASRVRLFTGLTMYVTSGALLLH